MHNEQVLKKCKVVSERLDLELSQHARVNTWLFMYECIHLMKGATFPSQHAQEALNLVTLQDKYKFQIIIDILELMTSETDNLDDVRRITKNAIIFLRELQNVIYQESYVDSLTGVWNYNYLKKIEHEIAPKDLTIFFFDLDGLKEKNDIHGHEYGNKILRDFSTVLKKSFRASDLVIRYGGDEFLAIVFRSVLPPARFVEKIRNNPIIKRENIAFSVGVSDNDKKDITETIGIADQMMYAEKESK